MWTSISFRIKVDFECIIHSLRPNVKSKRILSPFNYLIIHSEMLNCVRVREKETRKKAEKD